jgi:hypothetical protein
MRAISASFAIWIAALSASPAGAQALGVFAWQLEPYCNVVRFTVTPDGPAFRLTGFDDQCGAGTMPAAGVVTPNADGTFTLVFYLVTPEGQANHTAATLAPGSYSGPWKDDGGLDGTLRFAPAGPAAGAPRSVAVFQRRVTGICTGSEFVQKVREDGTVECGTATGSGGGDITGVNAGSGLAGGGASGDVTLGIAAGGVGSAEIEDGAVGALDINPATVQRRVTGTCAASEFVQMVHADGSVTCAAATGAGGGDITGVAAGTGLTGGGTNGEVTLAIAAGGVGSAQIANGSIAGVDVNAAEIQRRVTGTCATGLYFAGIDASGGVSCSDGAPGAASTALGVAALATNAAGDNTAVGYWALTSNTSGDRNTAIGSLALRLNTAGARNTAVGVRALEVNTGGIANTAIGNAALSANTDGAANTAIGERALIRNTTGGGNVAVGVNALQIMEAGMANIAVGVSAMANGTGGTSNVAIGGASLRYTTTADDNVAIGRDALLRVDTGSRNVGVGPAVGPNLHSGSNNVFIGHRAGGGVTTGSDNIHIGTWGADESQTTRIGNLQTRAFIMGVRGVTTGNANAVAVVIDSFGQLGTISSSRRTKEDIEDMGGASAGIFRLRPVSFRYIQAYADGSKPRDYGLIAEEVDEVFPDLVVRNAAGEVETVQYHKLVPMLLNEVQRLRREVDELRAAASKR